MPMQLIWGICATDEQAVIGLFQRYAMDYKCPSSYHSYMCLENKNFIVCERSIHKQPHQMSVHLIISWARKPRRGYSTKGPLVLRLICNKTNLSSSNTSSQLNYYYPDSHFVFCFNKLDYPWHLSIKENGCSRKKLLHLGTKNVVNKSSKKQIY